MYCKYCGSQIPDGAKFCSNCGAPATETPPQPEPIYTNPQPSNYYQPVNNTQPVYTQKVKKPIYKKWWFWLIIVIVLFGGRSGSRATRSTATPAPTAIAEEPTNSEEKKTAQVVSRTPEPEKEPEYLTEVLWAALEHYKCAVEIDDFDGDIIAAGTYSAMPTLVTLGDKRIPIIWDIYISSNDYSNISQLSDSEYVASVGGWDQTGAQDPTEGK